MGAESQSHTVKDARGQDGRLPVATMAVLGVVFGDIGTSPLYALRECFHGEYGIAVTPDNVLGVLSLMLWSLILVVSIKYLAFILRADHEGEGGVLALTALLRTDGVSRRRRRWTLIAIGLFGACLLYGDGMITPAISVLSAVEGLRVFTPRLEPFVIPVTVLILGGLFLIQKRGTARVGALFGPVVLTWFVVIAAFGLVSVGREPSILRAVNPVYGASFLLRNGFHGFLVLGAVFLVVTGAEALYADIGHFGKRPIRIAWFTIVLPALVTNYFGQGAVLLGRPEEAHHPFYAQVPEWAVIPVIILATAATIIASQAVISAAFSLTRQAIQLGYLPRLRIIHTSSEQIGQIYMSKVNVFLMICTIGLVLGFQSSSRLAAAYGAAVTATMLISTILFYAVAREKFGWSRLAAGVPVALFLVFDIAFFGANMSKMLHGAWFPFVVAGIMFTLMLTWKRGRSLLWQQLQRSALTMNELIESLRLNPPPRVEGTAVFLTGRPGVVPTSLLHNLRHNKVLHEQVAVLHISSETAPKVPRDRKVEVRRLPDGFFEITAHMGYMEDQNVLYILALAREQGFDFELPTVTFFLGRERLLPAEATGMRHWRTRLFAWMSANAVGASSYYEIPPGQVMEVGTQLQL